MRDRVIVEGLKAETCIGIYDWERRIRQVVQIDLQLGTDVAAAASDDEIALAVDYKAVSQRVRSYAENAQHRLVETFAETLAELLLREFRLPWVRVAIRKPGAVTGADSVGIMIERQGPDA